MNIPKLSRVTPADLDDTWRGLYRVGGIAAFLVVILNLIGWQLYRLGASEVGQFAREEPPIVVHQNTIQIERKHK